MYPGIRAWRRAAAITGIAVALACVVAAGPAAALAKRPSCTKKAIAAGLKRGANKIPGAPIEGFRCAGRWALAVVLDGVDDVPALFRAQGTRWVTVDREKPCNDHAVPKKIYAAACLAS
jgi:hypothetical protein